MRKTAPQLLLLALLVVSTATAESYKLVAWAPGYPGTREQAQPSMDLFADGVALLAGWKVGDLTAEYSPDVEAGRVAAKEAELVFATLPVFLEFGNALELKPLLRVIPEGQAMESWTLVARKGAIRTAQDLAGFKLQGVAGFSPRFVRMALADWGDLPSTVEISFSGRVLSVLRKAAKGEAIAALLDGVQADALEHLPFAAELEVVAVSPPMISSLLCTVAGKISAEHKDQLRTALLALDESSEGAAILAEIRVVRFDAVPESGIEGAQRPWGDASD